MGECGCSLHTEDNFLEIANGPWMAYGIYPGCEYCFNGIGVSMRFYDTEENFKRWADPDTVEKMIPDEYGGNKGHGEALPILEVKDLVDLAQEHQEEWGTIGEGDDQHPTIASWLEENGLELLNQAMGRCIRRFKEKRLERSLAERSDETDVPELSRGTKIGQLAKWSVARGDRFVGRLKEWDNWTAIMRMSDGSEKAVRC